MVLPSHGNCPECEAFVSWTQVLQNSLSVRQHNRVQRKRGQGKKPKAKAQAAADSTADVGAHALVSGRDRVRGRGRGTARKRAEQPEATTSPAAKGPSAGVGRGAQGGRRGGRGRGGRCVLCTAVAPAASGLLRQRPDVELQGVGLRDYNTAAAEDTACTLVTSDDEQVDAAAFNELYGVGGDSGGEGVHRTMGAKDGVCAHEQPASQCVHSSDMEDHGTIAVEEDESAARDPATMHQDSARGRKNLFASLQGSQVETFSNPVSSDEATRTQLATQASGANYGVGEVQFGGCLELGSSGISEPVSFQPTDRGRTAAEAMQPCSPGLGECMVYDSTELAGTARSDKMLNSNQVQCHSAECLLNTENNIPANNTMRCGDDSHACLASASPDVIGSMFELPPTPMSCAWSPVMQPAADDRVDGTDACMQSTTPVLKAGCRCRASPSRSEMSPPLGSTMRSPTLLTEGVATESEERDNGENNSQLQAPGDAQGPVRGRTIGWLCTAAITTVDAETYNPGGMHSPGLTCRNGSGENCSDSDRSPHSVVHTVQPKDRNPAMVINLLT